MKKSLKILNNSLNQLRSFENIQLKIHILTGMTNELLSKNPDLEFFLNFNILICNEVERVYGATPLTSVSVERSFLI